MARRNVRSRPTGLLVNLASDRFNGCDVCWRSDALEFIEDVLGPLRLKDREQRRIFRVLICPRCESRVIPGTLVVAASEEAVRQSSLARKFDRLYRGELERFHTFLIRYPMLGAHHPFGQLLTRAMRRAKRTLLEPSRWFRATRNEPRFDPRPQHQASRAYRFNQIGQVTWYLGSDDKTAAVEVLREPRPGEPLWIAEIEVTEALTVLDLRMPIWGEDPSGHWVLRNVVDRRFISEPTDDVDESRPQYRVPQFIADLARKHGFGGILYDSTRPSAYNNPDAVGDNLVVFDPIPDYAIRSVGRFEFDQPDHDPWSLDRWRLRRI